MRPLDTFKLTRRSVLGALLWRGAIRGAQTKDAFVYAGSFTREKSKSKGIYLFRLQTESLKSSQNVTLVPLGLAAETPDPSFVEIDPKRRVLFAVNAISQFEGKPTGAVSAFSIDAASGKLTLLNQRPSMGVGPCHLTLDKTGRNLLVANFVGGSVAVLPVSPDGHLGEATDYVQHTGKSIHPERQKSPHAHCVTLSADNRFVFVCDLGLDKVFTYRFDPEHGKISAGQPAFTSIKAGAGPRHMVFRPDGRFAYVVNEIDSTVIAFSYDAKAGALKQLQSISALPANYDGQNSAAEVGVHPSGKYLYASNRGHETVAVFGIDQDKGTLTYIDEQNTGGKTPRYFGILPSTKHLVIANQDSDTLLICGIDSGTGRLKPSGVFASAPSPTCVKFFLPA